MTTLDARGISCPEPLIMLKSALKTERELVMLVDSKNAFANCRAYAENQGYTVESENDAGTYKMTFKTKNE